MKHFGKLIDTTNTTIALLYQLQETLGQFLPMNAAAFLSMVCNNLLTISTQH